MAPDLTVVGANLGFNTAVVGNDFKLPVTWTVKNQGNYAPAQNWSDSFYLSGKNTYDSSAQLVAAVSRDDSLPLAIGGAYSSSTTLTIPNTALQGQQYLLVVTDPGNTINESNTANNTFPLPITLSQPSVDLAVSGASASSTNLVAGDGATVSVSWTVSNHGNDTAQATWSDGIYLSSKTTYDTSAVALGDFHAPHTLAAGGNYSQTQTVTIPNTTLLGNNENILIVANDQGDQGENSTAGGTAAIGNISVSRAQNVDLEVVPGSVTAPASATLGQSINVSWTVKNIGSAAAGAVWTDIVYASPTAAYNSATATSLHSFGAPSTLAAGASYAQTQSVLLPAAAAGDGFILVRTNAAGDQAESDAANDTNNVAASTAITLGEPTLPTLAITSFTAPANANLGDAVTLNWSVKNTSSVATAASWSDDVYVSDKSVFDTTAQYLTSFQVPLAGSLAGGASYNQSEQFTLPYTPTGSRYLFLVADAGGAQPVSNSGPIAASSQITLAAPDLTVTLNAPPTAAVLGQAFNLSWTVTNTSSVAANASWEDAVFISSSANFDAATATPLTPLISGNASGGNAEDPYGIAAPSSLAAGGSYTRAVGVSLPSMPAGNYYLFVVADRENEQGKVNESIDNVVMQPIAVTGPDLTVQIDSAPSAAVAGNGQSVTVSWTVTNHSAADTVHSWTDGIYLSNSSTLNLNDSSSYWSLGSFSEPVTGPMNAGASYTNSQTVTIPNVLTAGTYHLFVVTNTFGYIGPVPQAETDLTNDIASAAISLTLPDVTLAVQSVSPNTFVAGGYVSLSWTVKNQGTDTAGGFWTDSVYLSSKPTLDSSATLLASYNYNGTANPVAGNGGSYTDTDSVTIPSQTPAGTMYLLIVPDSDSGQSASTSVFSQQISVTVPDVKLATAITSSPASGVLGQPSSLSWTVTNNGTATTSINYWEDEVYLSPSPSYGSSAVYVGGYEPSISGSPAVLPLGPGNSYSTTQQFTVPATLTPGNYFVLVRADDPTFYDYQPQSDASQSVASAAIVLTAGASGGGGGGGGNSGNSVSNLDLVVSAATAPPTVAIGSTIPVSFTVANQGTDATSQSWTDAVYLSNSPILNTNYARELYSFSNQSALNGGASYTANDSMTLYSYDTGYTLGKCYLVFVANAYGSQSEVNSSNNSFAVPITLTSPSLAVTSASFSGSGVEGSSVRVSYTVTNQGGAAAKGYWYDYVYLSDTPAFDASTALELGSFYESPASGVPVQGIYSNNYTVTLPGWATGNRYLLVVADGYTRVDVPAISVSNVAAMPITLTAPNLAISGVSVAPSTVEANNNATLNLSWTVTNTSAVNTGSNWTDAVYLSPTPVFNSSTATEVTTSPSQSDLAAGASYTTTLTNVAVPSVAPGTYYVFFATNIDYAVYNYSEVSQPESDPTDNILMAAAPITLTAPGVVLQASNVAVGKNSLGLGQSTTVSFQVSNVGSETAQTSWSDVVYLSSKSTFDNTADWLTSLSSKSPLAGGGAYYTQSTSITIPSWLTTFGTYYLFCVANEGQTQGELNYGGDVSAPIPITVGAPELQMSVVTSPASAKLNDTVSVSWTVSNISSQFAVNASYWYDDVYLSNTATLNTSTAHRLLNQYVWGKSPLAAGGSYNETANISFPNGSTGPMYLIFVADANDYVVQTTRANDIVALPITLTAPNVDLQLTSASATPTVNVNSYIGVSWSVTNAGTDPANGSWTDEVYLSSKSTFDSTAQAYAGYGEPWGMASLPAGAGYQMNWPSVIWIPSTFTPGTYYVFVVVDNGNYQSVTKPADGISAALPVIVTGLQPHLEVTAVSAPAAGVDGATIPVTWTVENAGNSSTSNSSWYDYVYASSSPTFDNSAQVLGEFYESRNLAAGTGQYTDTETVSLRGTSLTGPAYIIVVADESNSLAESNTSGNSNASGPITLSAPALAISDATAPTAGVAGGSIPISWTVTNTSSVSASTQWYDYIYVSPDNVYDNNARYVASFAAPTIPLAAQGSYTQNQNVTLPGTYLGSGYLLFLVDENSYQPQTNAANNVAAVPIDISAADLTVSSVTAPASASLGQPLTVSWTVKNIGTSPADQPWYDGVYYSTKNTFDSSAVFLKSVPAGSNSPLAAGGSYTQSAQVTLPSLAVGTYYLLVYANVYNQQAETNKNNNTAASAAVAVNGADLTVSSVTAPANASLGQPTTVTWTVQNIGLSSADQPWSDGVYYSAKSTFDNSAVFLTSVPAGSNSPLAAGGSYTQSAQVTLPSLAVGTYYFFVSTDVYHQQPETNENNNTAGSAAVAVNGADLTVSSVTAPASASLGQPVTVNWTVENIGSGPAGQSWTDGVYYSTKSTFDNSAVFLTNVPAGSNSPLAAGGSYTQSAQVTLPSLAVGSYYFL
ncbi:MAG: CARDB domain-containing protein, partial [Thermoguttaceae bacterium]